MYHLTKRTPLIKMESETNTTTSIKREMLPNNYTSLQLVGYISGFILVQLMPFYCLTDESYNDVCSSDYSA